MKLIDVRRIWDRGPHNAFTDLVRFKDAWYCVFREAADHNSSDGALQIITSGDGERWESAGRITSSDSDLRDAKINVTPDGRLMLTGCEARHATGEYKYQSLTWFSHDGRTWSARHEVGDRDYWLWRCTWHEGQAYGLGYGCGGEHALRLYRSADGKRFETIVERLTVPGFPNETSLLFDGETCYCLLRRDEMPDQPDGAMLGVAQRPYTQWRWRDLGVRIGGPHMLRLPDGRFIAALRFYEGKGWHPAHTSLAWIDPVAGTLTEALRLPSGGDTSYAGLVWHEGLLWISYYSSHEGKTSIYLAKAGIPVGPRR